MASQMVLRCGKTGLLFFDQDAAKDHAEAHGGGEYAQFEEVSLDSKIWWCVETGRHADTPEKMNQIKSRDRDSITWEEKDIAFLMEQQKKKAAAAERKNKFFDSVDQKKLQVLTEVKKHGRVRSAKALHFTRETNTVEAAEAWLTEHAEDAGLDKLDDAWLEENASGIADVVMADEDVVMEQGPDTRQKGDPNPDEVKEFVNKEVLATLMEMGFTEVPAEKALFLRENNLEHAIAWLGEQNQEDPEYELPMKPKPKVVAKPKISKEEAAEKAMELQKRLRQKKAEEEKLSEKEKERMRVESTKMMVEAQERLKEEERKRAFEQMRIEKEAHEKQRAELKEQLRLDYINRFGCEPPPEEEEKEKAIKEKPLREQLLHWLGKLKKTYKDTNKDGLKTCLTTLKIYGTNLKDNPAEPKFKTLKVDNKAFQARIAPFEGAIEVLECIGFENKGDVLEHQKGVPDGFLIGELIKFADIMLGQL